MWNNIEWQDCCNGHEIIHRFIHIPIYKYYSYYSYLFPPATTIDHQALHYFQSMTHANYIYNSSGRNKNQEAVDRVRTIGAVERALLVLLRSVDIIYWQLFIIFFVDEFPQTKESWLTDSNSVLLNNLIQQNPITLSTQSIRIQIKPLQFEYNIAIIPLYHLSEPICSFY